MPRKVAIRGFLSESCWGKATVAYTKLQQRKKEESEGQEETEIRSSLLILDLNKDHKRLVAGRVSDCKTQAETS